MEQSEKIIAGRIYQLIIEVFSKIIKPDITIDQVTHLTEEKIEEIKKRYGIEGIILDVDKTLRRKMKPIPEDSKKWIKGIQRQLKVIVVSNGLDSKVKEYLKSQGIEYIGFAKKPLKINFEKACKKINVPPEKILVVGNSLLSDILGGNRSNMKTAHVRRPVEESEK